ncbi:AbrB/MazE/SpoVT family DNA-binding domain-containing protein [Bacillus circulans]|nr:AbrB/MazE/SpoVT family DNA-binding domain-containing protein [Niallia circulans]
MVYNDKKGNQNKSSHDKKGGKHMTTLQKWGNSLAVRIPTHLAKNIGVDNGSEIELQLCDDGIMIRPAKTKPTLDDLLAKIKGRPNPHLDYDFGKPEGKEYI